MTLIALSMSARNSVKREQLSSANVGGIERPP